MSVHVKAEEAMAGVVDGGHWNFELARGHFGWVCEGVRRLRAGLIGEWCGGERELLRRGVGNGVAVA